MRIIRLPNVAADFRVPPKWPQPTDAWIRANLFWEPPEGWVPIDGLPPAPPGWKFWRPNPTWHRVSAPLFRRVDMIRRVAVAVMVIFLVVVVTRFALPTNSLFVWLSSACALAGLTCLIVSEVLRSRTTRAAINRITIAAAEERHKRVVREYQRYLREAP